jgi:hypothetical protein
MDPSFVQIDPLDASSTSHAFSGERTAFLDEYVEDALT